MTTDNTRFQTVFVKKLLECDSTPNIVATLMSLIKQTNSNIYNKLRVEVPFGMDELFAIAKHYALSIDQILGIQINQQNGQAEKQFEVMQVVTNFETMTEFLQQAHKQLRIFKQMPNFEMTYIARDMPLFLYFAFPELGALKAITWVHQSIANKPRIADVPVDLLQAGAEIYEFYKATRITEIWSTDTLNNILNNVLYYSHLGVLTKLLAQQILDQISALLQEQRNLVEHSENESNKTFIHSPFIMMSNGALMHIGEYIFGMLAVSSVQTVVVHHPTLMHSLRTSINWHLANGTKLHLARPDAIASYYNGLQNKIAETKMALNSI